MKDSLKKAQKNYMNKKIMEGWRHVRVFIPIELKTKLLNFKNDMMQEYYEKIKS
jgi:hypothetical protein